MKKTISIKENKDFKKLYYRGKSVVNEYIVVYYRQNPYSYCRLGITVSSKVGKAVVRNRVRRLIRESYRLMEDRVRKSMDIVVVARNKAAFSDYAHISAAMEKAFIKSGIVK